MTNETDRAEFEAKFSHLSLAPSIGDGARYLNGTTDLMWQAWQAARASGGWREIDSVPKDGTAFLLSNGFWAMEHKWEDGRFYCYRYNNYTADSNCKYWQPLPHSSEGNLTPTKLNCLLGLNKEQL